MVRKLFGLPPPQPSPAADFVLRGGAERLHGAFFFLCLHRGGAASNAERAASNPTPALPHGGGSRLVVYIHLSARGVCKQEA